jgi:uncharacterized protein YciI
MYWAIRTTYVRDYKAVWSTFLTAHVAYLKAVSDRILAAGGLLSDDGSQTVGALYLIEAESREAARRFIDADPFLAGGVIETVEITRWRRSFFDRAHLSSPAA